MPTFQKALVAIAFAMPLLATAASPARTLIVTGQSDIANHDWRATTPFLKDTLESTGRFDIRVTEEPRGITRESLQGYDAILLNYNGPRWGSGAEAAVEEFVRSGKGLVSFHGATYGPLMGTIQGAKGWSLAPAWSAYSQMLGVKWPPENIGHASRHAFTVKLNEGAITHGMPAEFLVNDELYHKMSTLAGIQVLATAFDDTEHRGTGKQEPIAWTVPFGKGRVFYTTLGHDTNALYQTEVKALFARAVEWAATGEVTLPPKLEHTMKNAIRVLVVTGGHSYEPTFYDIFNSYPDVQWTHAASQKDAYRPGMKKRWDVVVLYDMGNQIEEEAQKNLKEYVDADGGLVALHHSIVDYTSWPWWFEEVIGGKYYEKPLGDHQASHFKHDTPMTVRPVKGMEKHPILRGIGEIVTIDECYLSMWHSEKIQVLMDTDCPCNDRPAVYLGPRPGAHSVYIQLGHDPYTFAHPGYRRLVHNAIVWAAAKNQ